MRTYLIPVVLVLALLAPQAVLADAPRAEQIARPAPASLDAEQTASLGAGELITSATIDDMNRGEVVGVIDAPMDQILTILQDYDNYPRWYPDQREATLLTRQGNYARARGEVRMPFPFPNRRYDIDVERRDRTVNGERHVTIRWRFVPDSGNFAEMYGFWYLMPFEGDENRILCRYVLYADLGTWLPDAVIRWAQRRMLPGIIEGIREYHAERFG